MKTIIVIIGSYPDVGKGTLASSIGYLLKKQKYKVNMLKFDGYLNPTNGNMNPYHVPTTCLYDHEELFVLNDGTETDSDHGNYERFLDQDFNSSNYMTNGSLILNLIDLLHSKSEKPGEIIKFRHLREMIKKKIVELTGKNDVLIIEVGGSVGDEESINLYTTLSNLSYERDISLKAILLSPYFYNSTNNPELELSSRTKITRKSFIEATKLGLRPNFIFLKNDGMLIAKDLDYIASDCGIDTKNILSFPKVDCLYSLPRIIEEQNFVSLLFPSNMCDSLNGPLEKYVAAKNCLSLKHAARIGIFGKTPSYDSYISLIQAVEHASVFTKINSEIIWIDDLLNKGEKIDFAKLDGLIVAEGLSFVNEKIKSIQFFRENNKPLLAISFGTDLLIKEFFTNKLKKDIAVDERGDSMHILKKDIILGSFPSYFTEDSLIRKIYGTTKSSERYRYCPTVSEDTIKALSKSILKVSGFIMKNNTPCTFELPKNKFFIGTTFHPEYLSRPGKPRPIFVAFLSAVSAQIIQHKKRPLMTKFR